MPTPLVFPHVCRDAQAEKLQFKEECTMKKFINKVENVELEMLEGIAKAHPAGLQRTGPCRKENR